VIEISMVANLLANKFVLTLPRIHQALLLLQQLLRKH
jgi:hypothetical protein